MRNKKEIKPNDQSWVGKFIREIKHPSEVDEHHWLKVKFVGEENLVLENLDPKTNQSHPGLAKEIVISLCSYFHNFELYEEPEKKCEHEWDTSQILTSLPPQYKCKKCFITVNPSLTFNEFKEEPFWLKVGDIIRDNNGSIYEVMEINLNEEKLFLKYFRTELTYKQPFKFITQDNWKKIKLVSPAVLKSEKRQIKTQNLFKTIEEISDCHEIQFLKRNMFVIDEIVSIQWPARDQFGKEIWYEVEG